MEIWLNAGFIPLVELPALARAAEALGYAGIAMPDHLFFPSNIESRYPYSDDGEIRWPAETPWADPWVAIAAMGSVTTTLRFSTGVQIAPLRDPFSLAKSVSTAHELTGGRIRCGFGVGWLREEFDALGIEFASRGRRFDEMLDVLRLLWTGQSVSHHGEFFSFESIQMCPPAVGVPIDIGGTSGPAIRRAAKHDGWIVPYRDLEQTIDLVQRMREERGEARAFQIGLTGPELLQAEVGSIEALKVASLTLPIAGLGRSQNLEERLGLLQVWAVRLGIA